MKKYFAFYQSHTKSNSAVDESTSNDIEKYYKHSTIKASVDFFIFGFIVITNQFSKSDENKQSRQKNQFKLKVQYHQAHHKKKVHQSPLEKLKRLESLNTKTC